MLLTLSETQNLLRNTNIHWSIKSVTLNNYINENPKLSEMELAYRLNLTEKQVQNLKLLYTYRQKYPLLKKIKLLSDAVKLVNKYKDSDELRAQIILATLRNKSRLETEYAKRSSHDQGSSKD